MRNFQSLSFITVAILTVIGCSPKASWSNLRAEPQKPMHSLPENDAEVLEREKQAKVPAEPKVPYVSTDTATVMTRTLNHQPHLEAEKNCPSARTVFAAVDTDPDYLEVYVNTLRRDLSECLWGSISSTKKQVDAEGTIGMVFGFALEVSAVVGYGTGTEFLVTLEPGTDNLLFGVYGYRGYDMSLGLPGAGAVQGFVYGDCGGFPLSNYTGWFRTLSGAANNYSFGKNGWWSWEDTNCNAWTITRGTTTPVLGFSRAYYMQEGRYLRVKGDYFAPTVAYLKSQK